MNVIKLNNVYSYGAINSAFDIRDYKINAVSNLPDEYAIDTKIPVKNQKNESTCVAHALSVIIEYHYLKCTNTRKVFSTEFIYGYRERDYYIGDGMVIRDALKTITKLGDTFVSNCRGNNNYKDAMKNVSKNISTLKEFAYPHRISAYAKLTNNDEMKTAIMNNGPIIVSMNWYKNCSLINNIYTYRGDEKIGRHCVVIYGWNKYGWLVQNSWGAEFGEHGRFIIPYTFKFNEAWSIIDNINDTELMIKKLPTNHYVNIIYKIYNAIVNFYINNFTKNNK